MQKLEEIRRALFRRESWKFSYVGEESFLPQARELTERFLKLLDDTTPVGLHRDAPVFARQNEGLYAPSQVQYAALCGKLPPEAMQKRGTFMVLEHLLNTDYLWQNVRVLGGAYGVSVSFGRLGSAVMVSYRDPNLDETYAVYRRAVDYIRSLDTSERDFRQYVIGALNKLDRPHPAYVKGLGEIQRELCGVSIAEFAEIRRQIIHATPEDVKALVPYLEAWLETATETVIGNEQKIRNAEIRLDSIGSLL